MQITPPTAHKCAGREATHGPHFVLTLQGSLTLSLARLANAGGVLSLSNPRGQVLFSPTDVISGNTAGAGALCFIADDDVNTIPIPSIPDGLAMSDNVALNFGLLFATEPASFDVAVTPSAPVRTSESVMINVSMYDGFRQQVQTLELASVECAFDIPSPLAAACAVASLSGSIAATYARGAAIFSPVLLFAPPGTVVPLRVTVLYDEEHLTSPVFNVTIAPCRHLEHYDNATRLCVCSAPAVRMPTGECSTPAEANVGLIAGVTVGSCVFALIVATIGAVYWARRAEDRKWRRKLAHEKAVLGELMQAIGEASKEVEIVREALKSLRALFPTAKALAVGAFNSTQEQVVHLETFAASAAVNRALRKSIPTDVGIMSDGAEMSSVVWATEEMHKADSKDFPRKTGEFLDWVIANADGMASTRAVTAPLSAGQMVLGFVVMHFDGPHAEQSTGPLMDFCNSVGATLFTHRALSGFVVDHRGSVNGKRSNASFHSSGTGASTISGRIAAAGAPERGRRAREAVEQRTGAECSRSSPRACCTSSERNHQV